LSLQKQNEFSAQYLRASFANSISQMSLTPQTGGDLSSIWQHEWAKQNENRTLKMILQSVEAGGTAYILYEHIKKYGLK
jgi:predicted Rdx family selenoprotein